MVRQEICNLAGNVQDSIIEFVRKVNQFDFPRGYPCKAKEIEIDGYMMIFRNREMWQTLVDAFIILGMDFTTGEPDGEYDTWYIDFEFSDGMDSWYS